LELSRIRNTTLRQLAYEEIKERIISADLLPGQEINIVELADKLGVSTMPVREALRQLASEHIITIQNKKASRINELTRFEFDEILKIRLNLETMAGKRACELVTEQDITRIEKIVSDMQNTGRNLKLYLKKNRELHFSIYKLAKFPILLGIIDGLWARIGPYFNLQIFTKDHLDEFLVSHLEMCEALREKDKALMAKALKNDMKSAARRIRPMLKSGD
jgi:DNA-binding GntR family transcriptional regulator